MFSQYIFDWFCCFGVDDYEVQQVEMMLCLMDGDVIMVFFLEFGLFLDLLILLFVIFMVGLDFGVEELVGEMMVIMVEFL